MAKRKQEEPVVEVLSEEVVAVEPVETAPEVSSVAGIQVVHSQEKVVMGKTYTEVLLADGSTQLL